MQNIQVEVVGVEAKALVADVIAQPQSTGTRINGWTVFSRQLF